MKGIERNANCTRAEKTGIVRNANCAFAQLANYFAHRPPLPKIDVFTHLFKKTFYWQAKAKSAKTSPNLFYGKSKWPLFTPKTAWIKIAQKRPSPLNTKMAETVTLGLAKPLPVTNLGRRPKIAFIYPKDGMDKNCSKTSLGVHWTQKRLRQ